MQYPMSHRQRGISLIESLVAMVVTALGILGVLGVQMRTLADTQTSVGRGQAIRLIDDLGERMKVNPNALGNIDSYAIGWRTGAAPTARAARICESLTCTHAEYAAYDIREWKRSVERALPQGDARVFAAPGETTASNRRQLGILIRWRENEREVSDNYRGALSTTTADLGGGGLTDCPATFTCHLQYIPVSARCAPYFADTAVQYFCPGPK